MSRSENWRINKSGIMAVEGAQALKALQKVAGAAGLPKDYKVKFATQAHGSGIDFDEKEVVIGAGRLFQEAPISAALFDVLVGLTLHEVGHKQIGTDSMWKKLERRISPVKYNMSSTITWSEQEKELFQKFTNIGEDIAIESEIRANPNLAEYDEALHSWAASRMREVQPDKLMEVWIEYALGHKSTTIMDLPEELVGPMQQLVALTGWLRNAHGWNERANSYLSYWQIVKDAILNPPKPQPDDGSPDSNSGNVEDTLQEKAPEQAYTDSEPSDEQTEPPSCSGAERSAIQEPESTATGSDGDADSAPEPDDDDDEMDRPLAPSPEDSISDELADAIEDAIESDSEDVTEQVAEEFGQQQQDGGSHVVYPVIRSRETKTPLVKPDSQLRKKLERIMTIRKRLQARTMRGEQYGKIDKSHLHRIGTDERIFSLRYKFPDGFPNTRILIDLSVSMSGKQAAEVLEAAGALQTLVNAEVWCYNRYNGKVNLVRVDEGKLIRSFEPDGDTPSGLAIVCVSLGMKKDGLIIHLTDGEHNVGQTPWTANWILKKHGVNLVNLIWGSHTKHYDLDGINYRQLDGLAEFPNALYNILIEQVKLSKIGGK